MQTKRVLLIRLSAIGILAAAALAGCNETTREAPALATEARQALDTMVAEAGQVTTLIDARRAPNSPEYVQVRLDWIERQYDTQLLQHPESKAVLIEERGRRAQAIRGELEQRPSLEAPRATLAMGQFGTAEAALLRAIEQKATDEQKRARDDMASAATHAYAAITEADVTHGQTVPWRTLKAKWLWRAANASLATTPRDLNPETVASQWINTAQISMDGAAARSPGGTPFPETFGLARLQSLKAAMHKNDAAVHSAAAAMVDAARVGVQFLDNSPAASAAATPDFTNTYIDWSKKSMDAEWLLTTDPQGRVAAVEAHAARLRTRAAKNTGVAADELSRHMLAFAVAEAEYHRATLK